MLEAIQIHKYYGIEHVLNDVSVRVDRHDKIGVIGRNGAGKTTLIQILTGVDTDFQGKIVRTEHETVAFVSQFFPNLDISALDYMIEPFLEMRRKLNALEETMSVAEGKDLERACTAYGELRSAYDAQKGDDAEQRALTFLENIRLSSCADTSVSVLSGGERNILAMGRALVQRADILILDEPGNHLDIPSREAIEDALSDFAGTILTVSHDRYFLDRIANRVIEISNGILTSWDGNFSEFWFAQQHSENVQQPVKKVSEPVSKSSSQSVEERIYALEAEQKDTERNMSTLFNSGELMKARTLGQKLERITHEIERLYECL